MRDQTRIVKTPKLRTEGFASLAVPTLRASTIVFPDAAAYADRAARGHTGYVYGLYGTPTTRALEERITALEHGAWTFLAPSGQAANAFAVLPFVKAGDHVLLADTTYPPMRDFADTDLTRFGVAVDYYDPTSIEDLERRFTERTRLVWCESPGSTTMEVQDLPRVVDVAHRRGALVACDNTWATPLGCKPIDHGADLVTEALTKYFNGHSDLLMGSISVARDELITPIRSAMSRSGIGVSADDVAQVLRGMETMSLRLAHASRVAERLMDRLEACDLVDRVLHPARPNTPGHDLWKRDFLGASGLFSVVFVPEATAHVAPALDVFEIFAIGASWGGTHSLVAPMPVRRNRTARPWTGEDLVLRFSVGAEAEEDLLADLDAFLADLAARVGRG